MTKVTIGLLSNRGFKGKTVMSLLNMVARGGFEFQFAFIDSGYTIAENRNFLAVQAIKQGSDYLFMADDDMIFPPEVLEVLVSRDKDIIGLPYNVKILPKPGSSERQRHNVTYFPTDELTPEDSGEGPLEVIAIGAGVILIKTAVFEKIGQPYFGFDSYENGMTKVGEDSWFCYKAARHGYKIWCERSFTGLGHIGDHIF